MGGGGGGGGWGVGGGGGVHGGPLCPTAYMLLLIHAGIKIDPL